MDDSMALDMLAVAAAKWPNRIAVRSGAGQWTFNDLDYAATEIAGRVANGSRIAFRAEMSVASIAALWGIPRGGGIAVPIDPALDVAGAAVLAEALGATVGWPPAGDLTEPKPEPLPSRQILIVATSGTGGTPRGVILTTGNIAAAAAASQVHLGTRPTDAWLLVMPLHHVAGLAILWRSAHDGSAIVMLDHFEPNAVAAALHGEATWVSLVPTMLTRLLRVGGGPWPHIRGALIGGAHSADSLIAAANEAGLAALPTYGMTETAAQVCTVRPGNAAAAAGTVGHPLPSIEVTIDAAPGEPGVIRVAGPTVTPGYVDQPALVGAFATNDIGYFDQTGRLVVLGRHDEVVVTGGENVHPGQVERAMSTLPGVTDAVAFGLPDEEWGDRLVAVVCGNGLVPGELLATLRESLPPHAVPKEIRVADQIPHLSNGKVDRVAVRRQAAEEL